MEQRWELEVFLDTTLLTVTVTTHDQDPERGQDIGTAAEIAILKALGDLSLRDAANRALGLTFGDAKLRAERASL